MTLPSETTSVPVEKTCAEIETVLGAMGATSVLKEIRGGQVVSLSFTIPIGDTEPSVRMPFRWEAIQRLAMAGETGYPRQTAVEAQARRVAARQVLLWIRAQWAFQACQMADVGEVFLGYLVTPGGQTIWEEHRANVAGLLGDGR